VRKKKNAKIRSGGTIIEHAVGTFGPVAGVTASIEDQVLWCCGAFAWDRITTKPSRSKLLSLGLDDVANDLWLEKVEFKTWKY